MSPRLELIFRRPNARKFIMPPTSAGIDRVESAKLLGVVIDGGFTFKRHIDFILQTCNQRLYLMKNLRSQGLQRDCINIVFNAIILGRITYAIQAWAGYLSQLEIDRVNKFLCKAHRWGAVSVKHDFLNLLSKQDVKLFKACKLQGHCLNHLFSTAPGCGMTLRPRGHSFNLPVLKCEATRKTFINRSLFQFK